MKKIHLIAAVALGAMTLTGCSNDEVESSNVKSQAIGFKAMANKSSRVGEITTQNIERFRVFGCVTDAGTSDNHVMIFNNVTVEKKADGNWKYDNTQYWAPSKNYYFVAFSTNNIEPAWTYVAPTEHPTPIPVEGFKGYGTVSMDVSKINAESDLVYAYAARTTDAGITDATAVSLTFNHMLSRIVIDFVNSIGSNGYSLTISNIKVSGLNAAGSVDLGSEPSALEWHVTDATNTTVGVKIRSNNDIAVGKDETSESKFIIPGEQTLAISFNVEVKLNNVVYSQRTMTGTISAKTYEPGVSYKFTANIDQTNIAPDGAKPIEFDVDTVNGWGTDQTDDVEFN